MTDSAVSHVVRLARTWMREFLYKCTDWRHSLGVGKVSRGRPLISVVVPTLCRDQHAHRIACLRELLSKYLPAQTYENYEVLVISDGPNAAVEELIEELGDSRLSYLAAEPSGFGGLPETSLGFNVCRGEFCVRMNDDNRPYPNYLAALWGGFNDDVDFVYARVVFCGEARSFWRAHFAGMSSYILPNDEEGTIHANNIDWMSFMFRTEVARRHRESMCRSPYGDWEFITELMAHKTPSRFVDRLIGDKH